MDEGRRYTPTLDELRATLAGQDDTERLRRFDDAVAAGRRLAAIRIAREAGAIDSAAPGTPPPNSGQ